MSHRIEIFSAGCPVCEEGTARVRALATDDQEIVVHDLRADEKAAERAASYGIRTVPAVVVDGQLLGCCRNTGPTEEEMVAAGIGQPAGSP
ncbi:MAG: thioredoxin family protein [Actinomycetota bacterium]|nr:thioredoxin family protein [Actinomycetota bacterium]